MPQSSEITKETGRVWVWGRGQNRRSGARLNQAVCSGENPAAEADSHVSPSSPVLGTVSASSLLSPELLYEDVFAVWEVIWAARHISSEHFVLFIALALVEAYREIIRDNNMDFTDIIKFFNGMR